MESSQTPTLFPLEQVPQVSDEEFNIFHSVDRELFTRLVHNLGRDPGLSMQVVAFFMWLEKQSKDMHLIQRIVSLPIFLLNELASEAAICLRCAESETYPPGDSSTVLISVLPTIMNNPAVIARFFHENRVVVLNGVTKIVNTICVRAFKDILQRTWQMSMLSSGMVPPIQFVGGSSEVGEPSRRNVYGGGFDVGGMGPFPHPPLPQGLMHNSYLVGPFGQLSSRPGTGVMIPMMSPPPPLAAMPPLHQALAAPAVEQVNQQVPLSSLLPRELPLCDMEEQRHMLGTNLLQMLDDNFVINNGEEVSNINNGEQVDEEQVAEEEVPADDRTIFLTFSRGYRLSEDEVRDFFTKRFGDFIEEIIMQEVDESEQPLFARMVVKAQSTAVIYEIVGGDRVKYSINRKHVQARKYVRRQQASSSRSSRQTSRPAPPEEQS